MTDADDAAVLRTYADTTPWRHPDVLAAIERAIELLDPDKVKMTNYRGNDG